MIMLQRCHGILMYIVVNMAAYLNSYVIYNCIV